MLSYTSLIIALDATPLTAPTGGIARYTSELSCALAKRFPQDEYRLVCDISFPMPEGAPPNLLPGRPARNFAERRWWLHGLPQEMSRLKVQVFHGTDFSVPYLRSRPAVMTLHDLSPWPSETIAADWQPSAGRIRRRTAMLLRFGRATMVITPSEAVRRDALRRFSLEAARVVVTPLAASPHFRPVKSGLAEPPYFLFVGTLEPRKNLGTLIEAWREVRRNFPVDLVLAGRLRGDYPAPTAEPGLRVIGLVKEDDLPQLYSNALAVVYPSLYEGFGLPVLEAMQCGAVVIASRDPAILEITGGTAALDADAGDTAAWTKQMMAVAEHPGKFEALRRKALDRASEFSWQATAERTHEVYEEAHGLFRR